MASTMDDVGSWEAVHEGGLTGSWPHAQIAPRTTSAALAPARRRKRTSLERAQASAGGPALTAEIPATSTATRSSATPMGAVRERLTV